MPKLLFVSTVASFMDAFLLPYAKHFRAMGWRVDALANGIETSPTCVAAFNKVFDITWSRSPWDVRNLCVASDRLKDVVASGEYDIVHVHTPVAAFVARASLRRARSTTVIYTAHGFHFHDRGTQAKNVVFLGLERLAGRWTDYLVVINKPDLTAARQWRIVERDRIVYMPGIGIDREGTYNPASVSTADVRKVRAELGIPESAPVFLKVAEFNPGKRHADALVAFAALKREDTHLLFAGHGPLMDAMQALADSLGVKERVHFLGRRNDVPTLMKLAAALLLCSDREGLPRSVMEAMSMGTPVIGTDVRGTRELLEDGAGFMYQPGDITALTGLMRGVLQHSDAAFRAARIAQEQIAAYDLRTILQMHDNLYSLALGNRAVSALGQPA